MKTTKTKYKQEDTAEEAIDSKCVIGSPTYLAVLLKYKSWLKTFSAYIESKKEKNKKPSKND